jgi:hypothetical protein
LTDLSAKQRENATESRKNNHGSQSLTQVDLAGKKFALTFGMQSAATSESTSQCGSQ